MGDVALTTPVLSEMSKQYPDVEVVMLTRAVFKPFFYSINGLRLFFPDFKNRHKGLPGLIRLFKELQRTGRFDYVIDLHDVLRSQIIRTFFKLYGVPVSVIDKGRAEKRSVIKGKIKTGLRHSVERYRDAFARAGFPLTLSAGPCIVPSPEALVRAAALTGFKGKINIGVAPYAKHKLKIWPEEYMIRLLGLIAETGEVRFWLFGGADEAERLAAFQLRVPGSFNTAGILGLDEEIALMSKLELMIAMDSSNMHMAALTGVKVLSVWGGTDPLTGFGAWMQPDSFSVRISNTELTCRPCTIFGKGECRRGDFACMNRLTPEMVFRKAEEILFSADKKR
jgi:ADP-heptose:LPS heptosyltransferase